MFKNRKRRAAGSQQGDQLYVSTGQTARDAERKYIKGTTTFTSVSIVYLKIYLLKIVA